MKRKVHYSLDGESYLKDNVNGYPIIIYFILIQMKSGKNCNDLRLYNFKKMELMFEVSTK